MTIGQELKANSCQSDEYTFEQMLEIVNNKNAHELWNMIHLESIEDGKCV